MMKHLRTSDFDSCYLKKKKTEIYFTTDFSFQETTLSFNH